MLSYDNKSGYIVVPSRNGHKITVAIEDTRPAIVDSDLAQMIQQAIDDLDSGLNISSIYSEE